MLTGYSSWLMSKTKSRSFSWSLWKAYSFFILESPQPFFMLRLVTILICVILFQRKWYLTLRQRMKSSGFAQMVQSLQQSLMKPQGRMILLYLVESLAGMWQIALMVAIPRSVQYIWRALMQLLIYFPSILRSQKQFSSINPTYYCLSYTIYSVSVSASKQTNLLPSFLLNFSLLMIYDFIFQKLFCDDKSSLPAICTSVVCFLQKLSPIDGFFSKEDSLLFYEVNVFAQFWPTTKKSSFILLRFCSFNAVRFALTFSSKISNYFRQVSWDSSLLQLRASAVCLLFIFSQISATSPCHFFYNRFKRPSTCKTSSKLVIQVGVTSKSMISSDSDEWLSI